MVELTDWLQMFDANVQLPTAELQALLTPATTTALVALRDALATVAWDRAAISAAIKEVLVATGLKMPQLAQPVRLLVCGRAQTPSIDAVLALFDRQQVLSRLSA